MPEEKLAALVRAVAWELIQLGYRPATNPCYASRPGEEMPRRVAQEIWDAMHEILSGRAP